MVDNKIVVRFMLAILLLCTSILLMQSYNQFLQTYLYYVTITVFVITILLSIIRGSEVLAFFGVFLFSLAIRLMYYVYTRFLVFPFGDPYGNFGVLRVFASLSHVTLIHPFATGTTALYGPLNPGSALVNEYSQWPGLQVLTLDFSRVTGLAVFESAISITLVLYVIWFFVSFILVQKLVQSLKILRDMTGKIRNLPALIMALIVSLPTTEMVPYFKYDLPATILLLASILLLIQIGPKLRKDLGVLFSILTITIVITHGLTSLFWMLIVLIELAGSFLYTYLHSVLLKIGAIKGKMAMEMGGHLRLAIIVSIVTISWWTFYAAFASFTVGSYGLKGIISSFSIYATLSARSYSEVGGTSAGVLASLTPNWLLKLLALRDYAILLALALGVIFLLVRPKVVGKFNVLFLLLAIAFIAAFTELFKSVSFNNRAFLEFAPLLGVIMFLPIAAIMGLPKKKWGKWLGFVLVAFVMITIAVGFWGSSYAPMFLYDNGTSGAAFGDHPIDYASIASFLTLPPAQTCVLTNEYYVTSLIMPTSYYNSTSVIGDLYTTKLPPHCSVIVFGNISSFSSSYVSEPHGLASGFEYSQFQSYLDVNTDRVFSSYNVTMYYFPS